jgi:hypothetical protein
MEGKPQIEGKTVTTGNNGAAATPATNGAPATNGNKPAPVTNGNKPAPATNGAPAAAGGRRSNEVVKGNAAVAPATAAAANGNKPAPGNKPPAIPTSKKGEFIKANNGLPKELKDAVNTL